jgi:prepilin-type N-terminal cleavage/methylation domain-containing protein
MISTRTDNRGFTLVELIVAIGIGLIVVGFAAANISGMIKTARADGGLEILATALRQSRELSVSERRNIQIRFPTTNNQVQIYRIEYPSGAQTLVRTITFEGRVQFKQQTGPGDTPDLFGNNTTICPDTTGAICLRANVPAMFTTDGSFVDSNGDVLNGTLFISVPGDVLSARAIAIFGPTGALRLWRWNGRAWVEA